jgi:hypothetical protein
MPCQFAGGHLRHRRHRKKLENKELRHTWRNQRVAGSVHKQKQSPQKTPAAGALGRSPSPAMASRERKDPACGYTNYDNIPRTYPKTKTTP